jgi:hypothetical protein
VSKNGGVKEGILQSFERALGVVTELKRHILFGEVREGTRDLGVPSNEAPIEVGKAQKTLNILNATGLFL